MAHEDRIHALADLPVPTRDKLSPESGRYWDKCQEKLGLVPNVVRAYSFDDKKLAGFTALYNEAMLGESELSRLEREMVAVVVSSCNRCFYCLAAHGAAVRELSGDPLLGEMLAFNYRVAPLEPRVRAMLDFAVELTMQPAEIGEAARAGLRRNGLSDRAIWDLCAVIGLFNMSNRIASGIELAPNADYHDHARRRPSAPAGNI